MMTDKSVKAMVLQAEHYKAIGHDEIWISREVDGMPPPDFPWEYVGEIEDGALHRLDVSVSLTLIAHHPCGGFARKPLKLGPFWAVVALFVQSVFPVQPTPFWGG